VEPDDDIVRSQRVLSLLVDIETAIDLVQITQPDNPACGRRFRPGAVTRDLRNGGSLLELFSETGMSNQAGADEDQGRRFGTGAGSGSYKAVPALASQRDPAAVPLIEMHGGRERAGLML
jgi:hypothetical protein